ncbi:MAG: hypothetical protein V3V20_07590 [Algisphaera sp.]
MKRLNLTCDRRTKKLRRQRRRSRGFTLIEAALTGVIVGTGVLAMVSAQQAYHIKNNWALRTGTGQLLANEMRELMLTLRPYDPAQFDHVGAESNEGALGGGPEDPLNVAEWDDVDDFAGRLSAAGWSGVVFNPPVNGMALPIDGMDQWSQKVTVEGVLSENLNIKLGDTGHEALGIANMIRVTCTVRYQREPTDAPSVISTLSWVVAR